MAPGQHRANEVGMVDDVDVVEPPPAHEVAVLAEHFVEDEVRFGDEAPELVKRGRRGRAPGAFGANVGSLC